jgi:hypothetical protein
VFVNSLERTGSRDMLERFSLAIDRLGPIMAMILLIPSSIGLLVLGLTAGFGIATGSWILPMEFVRYFLLVGLALTVVGPMVLPTRDSSNAIRLLLLPIPRSLLYATQVAGALADPWIALMVPVTLGIPIGMAVGLAFTSAFIALIAGIAFMALVASLTAFASALIHLLLRDRRRGELVMLLLIVLLPVMGILPQFLARPTRVDGRRLTRAERQALPPSRGAQVAMRIAPFVPSELYRRAAIQGRTDPASALGPLAALSAIAVAVTFAGFVTFRRVLDMPVSMGARRAGSFGGLWDRTIPGLSSAASAVAFAQFRLALRSPRGRATMFTPVLMPLMLGGLAYSRNGGLPLTLMNDRGLALAAIGCFAAILTLMPLSMNQFAIDRAGFTRQMLSPLTIRDLLKGKAVGNALIALGPALFCFVVPALVFPGASPALWVSLPIALIATYLLFAPAAAALSALFPKAVDLNSIGSSGQAHQAAGLLGILSLLVSAAPAALLTVASAALLHRTGILPLMLLVWCAVAFGLSQALFIPVRRLVESRCETLAQYY